LHHRILDDVERFVGITDRQSRHDKTAPFHIGEKTIQGFRRLQQRFLVWLVPGLAPCGYLPCFTAKSGDELISSDSSAILASTLKVLLPFNL
jgi:hypothetical protein